MLDWTDHAALFSFFRSDITRDVMICSPYCITSCLMPAVDFGNCGKPIASRALRKSFSVTNTWNDKASHSVMQLNTARKVCSLFVIRNFFIGPGQVKVIMDDEVDGFSCGFSIFFRSVHWHCVYVLDAHVGLLWTSDHTHSSHGADAGSRYLLGRICSYRSEQYTVHCWLMLISICDFFGTWVGHCKNYKNNKF